MTHGNNQRRNDGLASSISYRINHGGDLLYLLDEPLMGTALDGNHKLTPLHIELVLWYNSRGIDIDNLNAPAVKEYLCDLVQAGILTGDRCTVSKKSYTLTEKGEAYLDALLSMPFPTQKWEVVWPRP